MARTFVLLLLVGCSYTGHAPEYEKLHSRLHDDPAWTPSPEGSTDEMESRLLSLLDREPAPDLSGTVALDDLVRSALARNPELRASLKRLEAAVEEIPRAASAPEPELELGLMTSVQDLFGTIMNYSLELMQPVLFPGKLETRARRAIEMAWEASEQAREEVLELRLNVAMEYATLYRIERSIRILRDNLLSLDGLTRAVEARFESGAVPVQDVLMARLRAQKLRQTEFQLLRERRETSARLGALLGRRDGAAPEGTTLPEEPADPEPVETLWARAFERRPEVAAMTHRLRAALAELRMTELDGKPDVTAKPEISAKPGGDDDLGVSLSITLPFLRPDSREASLRQARAVLGETAHRYEALLNEISRDVSVAHARVIETGGSLRLVRGTLLPEARRTREAALAAYRAGAADFGAVLDAHVMAQEMEEEVHRMTAEHFMARETLRRAVGEAP